MRRACLIIQKEKNSFSKADLKISSSGKSNLLKNRLIATSL
jgi:hypothetical protein